MENNLSIDLIIVFVLLMASGGFIYHGGTIPIVCGIIGSCGAVYYGYRSIKKARK